MEGFMLLSMLSLAMFFGSYLAGSVPLAMTFSESKLRFVSIFGAGLLVGTALAVIIPEGVQSIYEAETETHNHQYHKEAEHILEESAKQPPFNPPRIPPKEAQINQLP
uniref:Solute carrier family 39 member 9 n=1 Tax=Plectus sambesii TaxID=2011161 RepID=A0A914V3Q2_9BILA